MSASAASVAVASADTPVKASASASVHPGSRRAPAGERLLPLVRVAADVLAVWPAFLLAYAFAEAELGLAIEGAAEFSLLLVGLLFGAGLYRPVPSALGYRELVGVVRGVLVAGAGYGTFLFAVERPGHPRAAVFGAVALSVVVVLIARRAVMAGARALTRHGRLAGRRVVICGAGHAGRLALQQVVHATVDGRRVVGFVDDSFPVGSMVRCRVAQSGVPDIEVPVLGRVDDWPRVCAEQGAHVLLVTTSWADPDLTTDVIRRAAALGVCPEFVPDLGAARVDLLQAEPLGALPLLRVADLSGARRPFGKRAFDVVGALVIAVLTLPLWVAASVLVRCTSSGPVLFVQDRIGLGGRPFRMYKFRTMRRDADAYAPSPAYDAHPAITPVGRLLRVAGIDELPQLVNVLRGEMSLVGPRPEMPFIVAGYTAEERQRLHAAPGVTGVWQISPDRHGQIHENVEHDLYYVRHQSLLLDVVVLFETAVFTASLVAARLVRRLRRTPPAGAGAATRAAPTVTADYTLVALDQRGADSGRCWVEALPAAIGWASAGPVRVAVTRRNVAPLDAALAAVQGAAGAVPDLRYEVYRTREQLRAACEAARLVITDLPHVAAWAREAGVEAITMATVATAPGHPHVVVPYAPWPQASPVIAPTLTS